MQKKQWILVGATAVLLSLLVMIALLPKAKSVTGIISGYNVSINKDIEITQTDGQDYLIIPVNTDMKDTSVVSTPEGLGLKPLSDYLSALDTLDPKEIEYVSTDNDIEIRLNIIISDDLK